MQVQMYHVKPFPIDIRGKFKIPGNPYSGDKSALDYLDQLGVFFYRDEDHTDGILIGETAKLENQDVNIEAYYSSAVLGDDCDANAFAILEWDTDNTLELNKIRNKHGDIFAWLEFNSPKNVIKFNREEVHRF